MTSRYQLEHRLEAGELAELFLATRDGRQPVVVKLFHAKTSDVRYAQALAETSRKLNPIQAPGLVHFVEVGLVKGRLAVVREHLEGLSLGEALPRLVARDVICHPPVALGFILQLLEAVGRAHEAGAVHGALTPGNVLLSREGEVGVFDFGALQALQAVPALKALTGKGRDSYRASEVVKGEAPTEASDIYSIAAIAYELLTLREPVAASGVSTRREALPGPSRVDRRLNGRIDPIILRALDATAARRFRTCGEFASALRNFLASNGGMANPEDVHKFVDDVLATEKSRPPPGPVPFTEAFALNPVDGADLPPVAVLERTSAVEPRAAYTGPAAADPDLEPYGQDTVEAPPAFEEYKPPQKGLAGTAPRKEPRFEEGTDPGQAGPLEMGWEAPPGAAPAPSRRMSLAGVPAPRTSARNPRVKVIEDFAGMDAPRPEEEAPPEPPAPAPERRGNLSGTREKAIPRTATRQIAGLVPMEPPSTPMPPGPVMTPVDVVPRALMPKAPPAPAAGGRSGEREFLVDPQSRKRQLRIAAGIALVAVAVCVVGFRVYRNQPRAAAPVGWSDAPPPPDGSGRSTDPGFRSVDGALKKYLEEEAPPAKSPPPRPIVPSADARAPRGSDEPRADEPPPKARAAFLTVTSDAPVAVYIDGLRVKKKAPFSKYPVRPGERRIVTECLETAERHAPGQLTFVKGRERRIDERCRAR